MHNNLLHAENYSLRSQFSGEQGVRGRWGRMVTINSSRFEAQENSKKQHHDR